MPTLQMSATRVLVVEDDERVRQFLIRALEREGYEVEAVAGGNEALERQRSSPFDLVVLDLMLPDADGLDVLTEMRQVSFVPAIIVSGRAAEADRVLGLQSGADDYIVKPFSPRELAARVEAVLRRARTTEPPASRLQFGDLEIDMASREVFVDGASVVLTRQEFDLLAELASRPRRACSREELLDWAWGSSAEYQDPATVTEHVRRLRIKLEDEAGSAAHIVTVRGVGYRFDP